MGPGTRMRQTLAEVPDHVARLRAALARAKDSEGLAVTILPEVPGHGPVLTWTENGRRERTERPDMAQLADWAQDRWPAGREPAGDEERLLAELREAYPDTDITYHPSMGYVASPKGAQVSVDATLTGLARKLSRRLPGGTGAAAR